MNLPWTWYSTPTAWQPHHHQQPHHVQHLQQHGTQQTPFQPQLVPFVDQAQRLQVPHMSSQPLQSMVPAPLVQPCDVIVPQVVVYGGAPPLPTIFPPPAVPSSPPQAHPTPPPLYKRGSSAAHPPGRGHAVHPHEGRNLYVAGLPSNTLGSDLERLFAPFGPIVSVRTTKPDDSGRRVGFVLFQEATDATRAVSSINGHAMDGVALMVKLADARANCIPDASKRLFVRHVPREITPRELAAFFEQFGTVMDVTITVDRSCRGRREGTTDNMAYVTLNSIEAARTAVVRTNGATAWPQYSSSALDVNFAETVRQREQRRSSHAPHDNR